MAHKAKLSGPKKIAAIEKYLRGEDSLSHIATMLDVDYQTINQWRPVFTTQQHNRIKTEKIPLKIGSIIGTLKCLIWALENYEKNCREKMVF